MPRKTVGMLDSLPYVGNFLYVAQLDDGAIKVGKTIMPRCRLIGLNSYSLRHYGCGLSRVHIEQRDDRELCAVERDLIHDMQQIATSLPGRREFFSGVSFDAAVALATPRPHPAPTSTSAAIERTEG